MDTKLIQLRQITAAPLSVCKLSLQEANGDLDKAIDLIKVKGLNMANSHSGRISAEGRVSIWVDDQSTLGVMCECNSNTDFTTNSKEFIDFSNVVLLALRSAAVMDMPFDVSSVEPARKELVATTKENIVVRRWWIEESGDADRVLVFPYLHTNNKVGVLLTLQAPSLEASQDPAFHELGSDLAMQVAAMNPVAVSPEKLGEDVLARQKKIFEDQLIEMKKPQAAWPKIMEGKLNKWYSEVCLLNQESIVVSKTSVGQVIKNISTKLGGDIEVLNFVRCQVGEGIEVKQNDFAQEVEKLSGVQLSFKVCD